MALPKAFAPPLHHRYCFTSIGACLTTGKPITIAYELFEPNLKTSEGSVFKLETSNSLSERFTSPAQMDLLKNAVSSASSSSSSESVSNVSSRCTSPSSFSYPLVLLIAGLGAPGGVWSDDFCSALAAKGPYRVLRYDQRDTGRSTHMSSFVSHSSSSFPSLLVDTDARVVSGANSNDGETMHLRHTHLPNGDAAEGDTSSSNDPVEENDDPLEAILGPAEKKPFFSSDASPREKETIGSKGLLSVSSTTNDSRERRFPSFSYWTPLFQTLFPSSVAKEGEETTRRSGGGEEKMDEHRYSSTDCSSSNNNGVHQVMWKEKLIKILQMGRGRPMLLSLAYEVSDLVNDVVKLLDYLHVSVAHVVGVSTGGTIAQLLALQYPQRVGSLVLIGSHHDGPGTKQPSPLTIWRMYRCVPTSFPPWFSSSTTSLASSIENLPPSSTHHPPTSTSSSVDEEVKYTPDQDDVLHQHALVVTRLCSLLQDNYHSFSQRHSKPSGEGQENDGDNEDSDLQKGAEEEIYNAALSLLRRSGPLDYEGMCRQAIAFLRASSRKELLESTLTSDENSKISLKHFPSLPIGDEKKEKEGQTFCVAREHTFPSSFSSIKKSSAGPNCLTRNSTALSTASELGDSGVPTTTSSSPNSLSQTFFAPFYIPTAVISGTKDPLAPVDNAKGLSSSIPGSRLVLLPGLSFYMSPKDRKVKESIIEEVNRNVSCLKKIYDDNKGLIGRSHL